VFGPRRTHAEAALAGHADAADRLVTVRGWAATFDPQNYRPERLDDGTVLMPYVRWRSRMA
jgi:hypothetical protein